MATNSVGGTLGVAAVLCVVCSVLVSTATIQLRPLQEENKQLDIQKSLLLAAGLIKSREIGKEEVNKAFEKVDTRIIDLKSGDLVSGVDASKVDIRKESKDPKMNMMIPADKDIAKIKMRAQRAKVFFVKEDSQVKMLIIPVHGKGLWSTLYGFMALAPDTKTVKGFGFYEHGETPGLGGEVDNPRWKSLWVDKKVLGENFEPIIQLVKGNVDASTPGADHKVDGLSGATMTTLGVERLLNFWLSDLGYGPFLAKFRSGGIQL